MVPLGAVYILSCKRFAKDLCCLKSNNFFRSMAFLAFGITSPRNLAIATGVLVGVWGVLQLVVAYMVSRYVLLFEFAPI
jgi:hypothetical protein